MTTHRALSLAAAALGDSARTLDQCNSHALAAEVREARDLLILQRDQSPDPQVGSVAPRGPCPPAPAASAFQSATQQLIQQRAEIEARRTASPSPQAPSSQLPAPRPNRP